MRRGLDDTYYGRRFVAISETREIMDRDTLVTAVYQADLFPGG